MKMKAKSKQISVERFLFASLTSVWNSCACALTVSPRPQTRKLMKNYFPKIYFYRASTHLQTSSKLARRLVTLHDFGSQMYYLILVLLYYQTIWLLLVLISTIEMLRRSYAASFSLPHSLSPSLSYQCLNVSLCDFDIIHSL